MNAFSKVSSFFEQIELTSSRLKMESLIIDFMKSITPEEAGIVCYMLTERIAPMFVITEFNISIKSVIKTIQSLYPDANIEKIYSKVGDIGGVIEHIATKIETNSLSIIEVYERLWKIAQISGNQSVALKIENLKALFRETTTIEQKYIARLVCGKMRLGCTERTILSAYKKIYPEFSIELEYALGACSDIGYIIQTIEKKGIDEIKTIDVELGTPIGSQLVERAKDSKEIIKRYNQIYIQPKYDGLRCQIHVFTDETDKRQMKPIWKKYFSHENNLSLFTTKSTKMKHVKLFSRNLEEITHMFPDLVNQIQGIEVKNAIFDSEIVGISSNGKFLNFQETIKRKRKHDISLTQKEIPIKCFVFDCMYFNSSIIRQNTTQRLTFIDKITSFKGNTLIEKAPTTLVHNAKEIDSLFLGYIQNGLEGIIAKNISGKYQPGVRNFEWIKLKKSTNKQFADTVDVVVLGYYLGTGRRNQFGIGTLLTGILRSSDDNEILTIAKVGTGITDNQLMQIKVRLDKIKVNSVPKNVKIPKELMPDIIVEPEVVCVVEADEISKSENHTSGLSLRFPRLIQFDRPDKSVSDITTLNEITKPG